jgi:phosphatidylglycerophosphate synthase
MNSDIHNLLDHVTDVAAIVALTLIALQRQEIPIEIITAIATIALGTRYAKSKAGLYSNRNQNT